MKFKENFLFTIYYEVKLIGNGFKINSKPFKAKI